MRRSPDLYDLPALRQLAAGCPWLDLVPCVSHETGPGSGVEAGSALDVALRRGPWPDHEVYVCGSPAMVRATAEGLWRAGVAPDRIHVEDLGGQEAAG